MDDWEKRQAIKDAITLVGGLLYDPTDAKQIVHALLDAGWVPTE